MGFLSAIGLGQFARGGKRQPQPGLADFERDYWAPDRDAVLQQMRAQGPPTDPTQGTDQGGWGTPGAPSGGWGSPGSEDWRAVPGGRPGGLRPQVQDAWGRSPSDPNYGRPPQPGENVANPAGRQEAYTDIYGNPLEGGWVPGRQDSFGGAQGSQGMGGPPPGWTGFGVPTGGRQAGTFGLPYQDPTQGGLGGGWVPGQPDFLSGPAPGSAPGHWGGWAPQPRFAQPQPRLGQTQPRFGMSALGSFGRGQRR